MNMSDVDNNFSGKFLGEVCNGVLRVSGVYGSQERRERLMIGEVIEKDGGDDYRQIKLIRDEDRDLRFQGRLLAEATTSVNDHGACGRWSELRLYLTRSGKYVCQHYQGTLWDGESDTSTIELCQTEDLVFKFFGSSDLAKELYREANLDYVEEIE